jgi:hypothetical protein
MCQLQWRRDASLAQIKHFDIFEFKDCSNGTISRKDGLYIMIFCDLANVGLALLLLRER